MRRVKYYVACSLDRRIARADGGLDWLAEGGDYGYAEFIATVDVLLMGRKTYEQTLAFGQGWPYGEAKGIVFSRTRSGEGNERVVFTDESPRAVVERLQAEPGKDLWLVGGGELAEGFLAERLVDEIIVTMHPILLGDGPELFGHRFPEQELRLEELTPFDDGLVQMRYLRV